jgi:4-diphosphocytidyl-2-C-methyl-D-erythritol kinase
VSLALVTVRSPAKVNLGLSVGSLDPEGYHRIATVYHAVSLYDEVKARPSEAPGEITLTVTGEGTRQVPVDDTNLAVQAARRLAKAFDVHEGVALSIHKTIAVAGGLAGGSSDAAATLVACDALWGTGCTRDGLAIIAAEIGSDVPFCLFGGTTIGTGHGETLSSVLSRGSYEWVLGYADGGLATPDVYAELDRMREVSGARVAAPVVPEGLMAALRGGDPYAVGPALCNDLQPAAIRLRPTLRRTLELGDEYGALGSLVTGSGPTCLFLASDADHAVDLAVALSGSGLCSSVQRATGPVPGARIVT